MNRTTRSSSFHAIIMIVFVSMLTFSFAPLLAAQDAVDPTVPPDTTQTPTDPPVEVPTDVPTLPPTEVPTEVSTEIPTEVSTEAPVETPTEAPTEEPIATEAPATNTSNNRMAPMQELTYTLTINVSDWDGTWANNTSVNAWVTVNGTRYELDENGQVVIPNLPNGSYRVMAYKEGASSGVLRTARIADANATLNIQANAPVVTVSWGETCPSILSTVQAGDWVTIPFSVTNTSVAEDAVITAATIVPTTPPTRNVQLSTTTIAPGETLTGTYEYQIQQRDIDSGYVTVGHNLRAQRPANGGGTTAYYATKSPTTCNFTQVYSVSGTVTNAVTGEPIAGATIAIDGTELTTTTDSNGAYTISGVQAGTYTITASVSGYTAQSQPLTVDGDEVVNFALVPIAASVTGRVTNALTGDPIIGATVCIDDTDQCAITVAGGYYSIGGVLNGEHTATATADGYLAQTLDATVADGVNTIVNFALNPSALTTTFTITCAVGGEGTYQISTPDGTVVASRGFVSGESFTELLSVGVNFTLTATAPGCESNSTGFVAGDMVTLDLSALPTTGTLVIHKLVCDDIDDVTVVDGTVDDDDDCVVGEATFTIYLWGDGTADVIDQQTTVDGVATFTLAPGSYEIVEEGTLTKYTVEVTANGTTTVTFQNPADVAPTTGTLEITKYYCTDLSALDRDGDGIIDDDADFSSCALGDARFSIYLYGDGTDDYVPVNTGSDGVAVVTLEAGTYEVVEEGHQLHVDITVVAGETTGLIVYNPVMVDDDGSTTPPVICDDPAVKPTGKPSAQKPTVGQIAPSVKELPATGAGLDEGTAVIALAAASAAALAGAGALNLNRKR